MILGRNLAHWNESLHRYATLFLTDCYGLARHWLIKIIYLAIDVISMTSQVIMLLSSGITLVTVLYDAKVMVVFTSWKDKELW